MFPPAVLSYRHLSSCCFDFHTSGGFRGSRLRPSLWATDWRRHSRYSWCVTDIGTVLWRHHLHTRYNVVLKIFKMIATNGFLAALECTKFVFGRNRFCYLLAWLHV